MRRADLAIAVLLLPTLGACRDAVAPWSGPGESADTTGTVRLTWSPGNDLHVRWSGNGDSVLYAGDGFPGLPVAPGLLLRVPRTGGVAALLLPALQARAAPQRFAQPALDAHGERLAFFELAGIRPPATVLNPADCTVAEPVLDSVVLRVRSLTGPPVPEAALSIRLAGTDSAQKATLPGPFTVRLYPFQAAFAAEGDLILRADWSPDGGRIVYSDGLRLFTWTPGGAPEPVPGTQDALGPAWSPDGAWIAFTRLARRDSVSTACSIAVGRSVETQRRWHWTGSEPRVVLVRPDGSQTIDIGPGRDPAWTPDGALVFSAGGRLRHRAADGGTRDLPGSEDGRWPAVSRAGTHIAFVRRAAAGGYDVWVQPFGF